MLTLRGLSGDLPVRRTRGQAQSPRGMSAWTSVTTTILRPRRWPPIVASFGTCHIRARLKVSVPSIVRLVSGLDPGMPKSLSATEHVCRKSGVVATMPTVLNFTALP